MSAFKKGVLIAASVLLAVGLLLSASALLLIGFDFEKMNTEIFQTNTYEITEDFQNIDISGSESDIRFVASENGECKIICKESENIFCNIFVDNGTLTVKRKDVRESFLRIGIWEEKLEITVYLPKNRYETVNLRTESGDIMVPKGFYFDQFSAETTSGDIFAQAVADRTASLKSVSGSVMFAPFVNTTTSDSVKIETTSGAISVRTVRTKTLTLDTTGGDTELHSVSCDTLNVESVSGDIEFEKLEAYEKMSVRTTSGDVEGSLRSAKHIVTKTVSGDIDVPYSDANAPVCEIQTTSGDIEITLNIS